MLGRCTLRVALLLMLTVLVGLSPPAGAQVIPRHPRPFLCDSTCPPNNITISLSPGSISDLNTTGSQTIQICTAPTNTSTDSVYYNGTKLSASWTVNNNCVSWTTPSETYLAGTNTFEAWGCSKTTILNFGYCTSASAVVTHPALTVTPKDSVVTLTPRTTPVQSFTITNHMNASQIYTLTPTWSGSGVGSCSAPASDTVAALSTRSVSVSCTTTDTLNSTGIIQLKATIGSQKDSGMYAYTLLGHLTVSTAYTNQDDQDMARCAVGCFANTVSMGTVPYITRGAPRNVALVYNSDRVSARSAVYADVTMANGAPTMTGLTFQAQVHGVWAKFTNHETTLNFSPTPLNGSTKTFRLGGVINIDSTLSAGYQPGAYQMALVVTATFSDGHLEQFIDTTHTLAVLDQRQSKIAKGWMIAGVPMLLSYYHANGTVDQTKYMATTGDGSLVTYPTTNACSCGTTMPPGVFSTIVNHDSLGIPRSPERDYPDSSKEVYGNNNFPIAEYLVNRLATDTVHFTVDSMLNSRPGRVLTISDPFRMNGSAHTYTKLHYDANGHLAKIVEPRGRDNMPDSGRVTTVTVSSSGLLTTWKDPDGDTTHFGYDAQGRLDSLVDRNGHLTRYAYDSVAWKLDSVISPLVGIDFNSTGTTSNITLSTKYKPWQLVSVPVGPTSSTPATPVETDSIWAVVTDTARDTTQFSVDRWGQPLIAIGNDTVKTTYGRDANGFTILVTRPIGAQDSATYSGPFLTRNRPAGQDPTTYSYGAFNQISQISGPHIPTQTFTIGTRGHVDAVTMNGATTHFYHDASFRDTSTVDAAQDTTRYAYDSHTGNVDTVSMLARDSTVTSYRYTSKKFDSFGRDSLVRTSGTGSPTIVTRTLYDLMNRPDSVYDGVHSLPMIYTRDGINVTQVTDPKGQRYRMTYNALNMPVTQTDSTNRTTTTTYTSHLVTATVTNRRGQMTKYTYDNLVRLSHVHRPVNMTGELDTLQTITTSRLGDTVNAWNPVTREISYYSRTTGYLDSSFTIYLLASNRSFKRTYFHDSRGRVDSVAITVSSNVTGIDPYARAYHYDTTTALLTSIATGSASIGFKFDAANRPDTITYSGSSVTRNDSYTDIGTVASSTWNNLGLYRGYGYDSIGRIIEVDHGVAGLPHPDSVEFYTYDPLGELTQHVVGQWSDTLTTCGNQFFGNGCQTGEQRTYTSLAQSNFVWDSAGNLDSVKVGSADTVGGFAAGNRLGSWTGLTFMGDSDGNRDSVVGATRYTWSSDGRLLSIVSGSNTRIYDYDNYGQLARRTTNGTVDRYYLWDGGQLMAILDGSANTRIAEFAYHPGGTDVPLVRITGAKGSSTAHFYALDGAGNVIGQFSGSTLEQAIGYEPWGAARITSSTGDTTQLRWKGLLYEDGITSLYYARARWYDPTTRRFISPDPAGLSAGINQYAFAGGDPINGSDPSGMKCADPFAGIYDDCSGGGGVDPYGSGVASTQAWFALMGQGVCSVYAACDNGDITNANPMMPGYQDPFHIYGCGNFTDPQCDMLYNAIKFLMGSPDPSPCHQMGAEIAASLSSGRLMAGFPPSATADAYTSDVVQGVGGAFTELGNNAFYYGQNWLTYTAGHEMNHLYQGMLDNNPDRNTIDNPAARPAIACVYGASATAAVPGAYTGPQ